MPEIHSFLSTMTSFRVMRSICFFFILTLLPYQTTAQGKLALYLDFDCKTPSELAPSVSLPLSTCLVPVGAVSIAIELLPSCGSGTASMIMYEDTSCARNTFSSTNSYTGWSDITNCFYLFISKSVPGVMFTCDEPATDPQPTSTSSIMASIIAGVATGSASVSQATTGSTANMTSQKTGSPTTATSSPTGNSGGSSSTASGGFLSNLSTSDKIALGVGLGVGIPSMCLPLTAKFARL